MYWSNKKIFVVNIDEMVQDSTSKHLSIYKYSAEALLFVYPKELPCNECKLILYLRKYYADSVAHFSLFLRKYTIKQYILQIVQHVCCN